MEQEAKLSPG